MALWRDIQAELDRLRDADLYRLEREVQSACGPKIVLAGREVVCLASNDYLCLAGDPAVKAAAIEAIRTWGVGAGASRLVSGTSSLHVELERRLAAFKGAEAAVVASTGWMANRLVVHALAGEGDLVVCDKLSHASLLDAARSCGAAWRTYPHRDVGRLERLLSRLRGRHRRCLIATDSLFSMDGDLAPLAALVRVKRDFDAQLLIDEAHATGVLGARGRGAAELLGVEDGVDAAVGTLSKAIGALGGFIVGPGVLVEFIRNAGRAYVYTTAPPPAICAAAIESLRIIRDEPHRRTALLALADDLRQQMRQAGLTCGDSASQIIPVVIGQAARALEISRELFDQGFFVPAIRVPTVPRGGSRLRVSLCTRHDPADLRRLVHALKQARA